MYTYVNDGMNMLKVLVLAALVSLFPQRISSTELTFELPDREKQCFYEQIEKGTECTLEFQVIAGGNYDVDVVLHGPGEKVIHEGRRKMYDSIDFEAYESGEYYFCFSNEFSSFSHKVVYFDFIVGDEEPLTAEIGAQHTALTQIEAVTVRIHESLKLVKDYQVHHRLRESQGRKTANFLNDRVQYWSLGEAIFLVVVGLTQVFILRRFFTEKKSTI